MKKKNTKTWIRAHHRNDRFKGRLKVSGYFRRQNLKETTDPLERLLRLLDASIQLERDRTAWFQEYFEVMGLVDEARLSEDQKSRRDVAYVKAFVAHLSDAELLEAGLVRKRTLG